MEGSQENKKLLQKEAMAQGLQEVDTNQLMKQFKAEYNEVRNRNLLYQVPYLSELARRYQGRDDWASLLRAHSLYNSCALRDGENKEQWLKRAYQAQVDYWKTDLQSFSQHLQVTQTLKRELEEIRGKRKKQTERIVELFRGLECEPDKLSSQSNQEIYTHILDEVPHLSIAVSQDMIGFTKSIVDKSVFICGPPAFGYCVVAFGSLARGEATPYSDLEFMFLVDSKSDEAIKCFERLAVTIYFLIGNLGETKLKCMAIPELMSRNEHTNKLGHWFDEPVMSGFKIDGLGFWSGNIPTGGTTEQHNHLIVTVEELAERYKCVLDNPDADKSLTGDLTAMLASTVYISGEQRLHDEFRSFLADCQPNKQRQTATIKMLQRDVKKFNFMPDNELTHTRNLKFDIHRYPSLLTFNLKILYNIQNCNPWEIIQLLDRHATITSQAAEYLKFSLSCAQIIRLSGYFYHNSQNEAISVLRSNKDENLYKGAWYFRPEMLMHMFINLLPLKIAVTKSLSTEVFQTLTIAMSKTDLYDIIALTRYHCGEYEKVLNSLQDAYPDGLESSDSDMQRIYIHSAIECNKYIEADRLLTQRIRSRSYDDYDFHLLGRLYEVQCHFDQALDSYKTKLAILFSLHGFVDHPAIAQTYCNVGIVLHSQSNLNGAIQWYSACLNMRLRIYGDRENASVAVIRSNMGAILDSLCRRNEALEQFTACLDMWLKIYGDRDHVNIANVMCNKGVVLQSQSRFVEALSQYIACLEMRRRMYGNSDHLSIADVLGNIGVVLQKQSDFNGALKHYSECLNMRLRIYGMTDHTDISDVLCNMGAILNDQSKYGEALDRYTECLDMRLRIYGNKDQVDIANVLCNIGVVLDNQSKYNEALKRYKECLDMRLRIYEGKDHEHIADVLCNVGLVLRKQNMFDEALDHYTKCLHMRSRIYEDEDHVDIADVLSKIGVLLDIQDKYDEAQEQYSKCYKMWLRLYGDRDHLEIANVLCNIGASLTQQQKYDEALLRFSECLDIWVRVYGDGDHADIAMVLGNIGAVLCEQKRYNEALEKLYACLHMRLRIYGDIPHVDIASALSDIGEVLKNLKRYNEALEKYHRSLDMYQRVFGDLDHPVISDVKKNVRLLQNLIRI